MVTGVHRGPSQSSSAPSLRACDREAAAHCSYPGLAMSRPIDVEDARTRALDQPRDGRRPPRPDAAERRRSRVRRALFRVGQVVLGLVAVYYIVSVLLLVVYRFVA